MADKAEMCAVVFKADSVKGCEKLRLEWMNRESANVTVVEPKVGVQTSTLVGVPNIWHPLTGKSNVTYEITLKFHDKEADPPVATPPAEDCKGDCADCPCQSNPKK
ncbi:MAG: hypothetical protein AAB467_03990 [Patescibacteria group bacterium]